MSYIGTQPAIGQYRQLDNIATSFNGVTTTFTTSVGGQNVTAGSAQQLLVSLGGVIQQPNVNYTTSTNSITFATAPAAGLTFFAVLMGDTLNIGTPSDGSVTTAKLASNSVTTAKLDSTGIAPVVTSINGGPLSGARNRIINGDMRIDQRNAGASVSVTSSSVYIVDRWVVENGPTSKFSGQRSTIAPAGFSNSLLITTTSAHSPSGGDYAGVRHNIEGFNTAGLGWGAAGASSVTLSFWVRSSLTGTFSGGLRNSGDNRSYVFTYTIAAANTWEYKAVTISGDTSGTWLVDNGLGVSILFNLGTGSTFSTSTVGSWIAGNFIAATGSTNPIATNGATFYITGVQLEAGTVATPFERRSYGQELALCQRYYFKTYNQSVVPGASSSSATYRTRAYAGSYASATVQFPVLMRTVPTCTVYNSQTGATNSWRDVDSSADRTAGISTALDSAVVTESSSVTTNTSNLFHIVATAEL